MSISQDGNSFIWDGTVTITNGTDFTTGVATLVLTPQGGVGNLPVLAEGSPGLPPTLRNVTVNQVAYGTSLPAPSWTLVSPGGPGTASVYDLTFSVNAGQAGASGTMTLGNASDLSGTPAVYNLVRVSSVTGSTPSFVYAAQLCGDTVNTVTFTPASGNTSPQVLATVSIGAQPFDWRPRCEGFGTPTGTANTHIDLQALLNGTDRVAYGPGITGAGSGSIPAFPVTLVQSFGQAIGSGSYGRVSKGNAATLTFEAIETAGTTDAWSVPAASCSFTVKVDPVPSTN